jgi:hypothetical protein
MLKPLVVVVSSSAVELDGVDYATAQLAPHSVIETS